MSELGWRLHGSVGNRQHQRGRKRVAYGPVTLDSHCNVIQEIFEPCRVNAHSTLFFEINMVAIKRFHHDPPGLPDPFDA